MQVSSFAIGHVAIGTTRGRRKTSSGNVRHTSALTGRRVIPVRYKEAAGNRAQPPRAAERVGSYFTTRPLFTPTTPATEEATCTTFFSS